MMLAPFRTDFGEDRMLFETVGLQDARLIHLAPRQDRRGFFARSWCADSFKDAGIGFEVVQANFSCTHARGTIRGMHFQRQPRPDGKIVRCTRGRIHEVIADLRLGSPTFGQWFSTELAEDSYTMMYVPPGFAQGFQALTDDVVVEYFMGERFDPTLYCGFRYDDPTVGIAWPLPVSVISEQDLAWAPLASLGLGGPEAVPGAEPVPAAELVASAAAEPIPAPATLAPLEAGEIIRVPR
jgi:dTDP-4-dehydrorhamnose 3,5-epimerase